MPALPRTIPATVPVLMYHSVSEAPDGPLHQLAVPPHRLAAQLGALTAAGYHLVGLSEAVDQLDGRDSLGSGAAPGDRLAVLTFDDGYADFLHAGLPVLAAYGASATLYPSVGHLGGPATWLGRAAGAFGPLLTWDQLREVASAGIEIGNHGLVHHPLDVLPPPQVRHEVATSHDRLEQALGQTVRSFCYPHGYHDRAVRDLVAWAGHDNACEIGRRLYHPHPPRPGRERPAHRLAVPRVQPTADHTGPALLALAESGGPQLVPRGKRLAQPVWRFTRRAAYRFGRRLT